jgi:hypothetical protein
MRLIGPKWWYYQEFQAQVPNRNQLKHFRAEELEFLMLRKRILVSFGKGAHTVRREAPAAFACTMEDKILPLLPVKSRLHY